MILSNTRVYLCGQIENDPKAAGWRIELARRLPLINPEITVWDPMVKPQWALDTMHEEVAFAWKQYVLNDEGIDPEKDRCHQSTKGRECYEANIAVRRVCKQLANKCDWMIARISKTFTWGSIDELEIAIARRIPIFLWMPDGLISIYGVAGCVHTYKHKDYYVHSNIASLLKTIAMIDDGQTELLQDDPETWLLRTWKNAAKTNID